jgi:hypothetical protein
MSMRIPKKWFKSRLRLLSINLQLK